MEANMIVEEDGLADERPASGSSDQAWKIVLGGSLAAGLGLLFLAVIL
jgi:hypothetical protein